MQKNSKGRDYNELLIWSAALVTVVRYAAAFIASDATEIPQWLSELITVLMGISGIGMGVLDVIGGAYLFTGWQKKMPSNGQAWSFRFKVLTFFAIGLIVNGILILIPFTMSRVAGVTVHKIVGNGVLLFGWSAVVNIAPYLLIGGVAVGNQIVTIETVRTANKDANGSANVRNNSEQETNDSRTFASLNEQDKKFLIQNSSKACAVRFGVSARAIQKWRVKIEQEKSKTPSPTD